MADLKGFLNGEGALVSVTLTEVAGSAPRDAGTVMLVREKELFGTIGGGQLEYMAIDEARALLANPAEDIRQMDVPLGPEIGQCCGGRVKIALKRLGAVGKAALLAQEQAEMAALPEVLVFGAGHVGRALALAFQPLPVRLRLLDSRAEEIAQAPEGVETRLTPLPEAELRAASAGAAFIIATHDHALDFLLTQEALARGDAAYTGMIGSKTKQARFVSWSGGAAEGLCCPMAAANKGDNRPEVIAAFVVAEVMAALSPYKANVKPQAVKESK